MKAIFLHQQSVPCLTNIAIERLDKMGEDKKYYLNPSAILRYEPDGLVIVPPKFKHPFMFIDNELAALFRKKEFSGMGIAAGTLENLVSFGIISEEKYETKKFREYYVGESALPVHAFLDVTSRCNCDCIMCYHKEDLTGFEPSLKDVLKRLESLKKLGIQSIEFTGGEILLRKDIYDILRKTVDLDLNFYLMTNGEYLQDIDGKVIDLLKKNSRGIAVSLDGVGELHDRIRRRAGLFNKIINGLDIIHANQIEIYLVSTIFQENVDQMQKIISIARKYNSIVQFRPSINTGAAKINNIKGVYLSDGMLTRLKDKNVFNNFIETRREIVASQYYGCNSMINISVDVNGNVLPCVMDRKRIFGSITDYTQKEFKKDMQNEIYHFLSNQKKCRNCKTNAEKIKCSGFCRFSKSYKNS